MPQAHLSTRPDVTQKEVILKGSVQAELGYFARADEPQDLQWWLLKGLVQRRHDDGDDESEVDDDDCCHDPIDRVEAQDSRGKVCCDFIEQSKEQDRERHEEDEDGCSLNAKRQHPDVLAFVRPHHKKQHQIGC
eukprot:7382664-Prymnesium_polylepis.1